MKENKNIERLFQEKFKDFEVTPPDFMWDNIQEKLNPEKKKRRVIPFWFKASGIAASFVALFSVLYFNSDLSRSNNNSSTFNTNGLEQNSNSVSTTIEKENASTNNKEANNTDDKTFENHNNNATVSNSTTESHSNLTSESGNKMTTRSGSNTTSRNSNTSTIISKNTISNSYKNNSAITHNSRKSIKTNSKKNFSNGTTDFALASNNNSIKNKKAKTLNSKSKKQSNTNTEFQFDSSNAVLAQNNQNPIKTGNQNQNQKSSIDFDINNNNNSAIINPNNSIISNENNNAVATIIGEPKTDSIVLATVQTEENPLEKLLREKESNKVAKEKEDFSKWAVNSFISPVYFNSFSEGSPLSQEFASNSKTYNNTTSYGVGLSYQLSKKLAIKTGIGNLNLDYSTNDVLFYSSYEDQTGKSDTNIERNRNGKYLVLQNQLEKTVNIEEEIIASGQNSGSLNQQIQYVEVPMELSYALLDKKFGIAVKGGMSTLFLTKNSVAIETDNRFMEIGKASNLNSVHFSSNLGLGFSYNFLKNFQANVEPTLKYQINTFNENAGNFKPYVIGINTGISYKF
ncbi:hypothetical protein [Flavobacterium urocaniciphilum]|uniref:Outer membrane protein beta-barrel domain-containing protein n=1 Tax=Flavobacterium urocaniciphilum TaxID=1299341 RepID=A0A1H9BLT2_9FLAO|nr:hypothetical protein [Flavobacterium urocaniciphilum]SEP89912.1 hypothetical protein SAMN05444005_10391 [Flavobacterium urocaniciphilum]